MIPQIILHESRQISVVRIGELEHDGVHFSVVVQIYHDRLACRHVDLLGLSCHMVCSCDMDDTVGDGDALDPVLVLYQK